jgi:hypothetical protein
MNRLLIASLSLLSLVKYFHLVASIKERTHVFSTGTNFPFKSWTELQKFPLVRVQGRLYFGFPSHRTKLLPRLEASRIPPNAKEGFSFMKSLVVSSFPKTCT